MNIKEDKTISDKKDSNCQTDFMKTKAAEKNSNGKSEQNKKHSESIKKEQERTKENKIFDISENPRQKQKSSTITRDLSEKHPDLEINNRKANTITSLENMIANNEFNNNSQFEEEEDIKDDDDLSSKENAQNNIETENELMENQNNNFMSEDSEGMMEDININKKNKEKFHEETEGQNEAEETNPPLISFNSIKKCQFCGSPFDSKTHIPILFGCGHFFCKTCIEQNLMDDNGINCPEDGPIAHNFSEVKILYELIKDKKIQNERNPKENLIEDKKEIQSGGEEPLDKNFYCPFHKNQKLSHFIEETEEIICVFCAVKKLKNNPNINIKEISEKCTECCNDLDIVLEQHHTFAENLQDVLEKISMNKNNEIEKVNKVFNEIINHLEAIKIKYLKQIEDIFNYNKNVIAEKLDYLTNKIDSAESIKNELTKISNNNYSNGNFSQLLEKFLNFQRSYDPNMMNITINEINYISEDEKKLMRLLDNFSEVKIKKKLFRSNKDLITQHNQEQPRKNYMVTDYNKISPNRGGSPMNYEEEYGLQENSFEDEYTNKQYLKSDSNLVKNNFDLNDISRNSSKIPKDTDSIRSNLEEVDLNGPPLMRMSEINNSSYQKDKMNMGRRNLSFINENYTNQQRNRMNMDNGSLTQYANEKTYHGNENRYGLSNNYYYNRNKNLKMMNQMKVNKK
ncbi:MAG: RING finger protein [archaeon]|nr:RING finger protein [archaeon]